ncbi:MAG: molybdenum ABC transporter ATP-binding protein [Rhodobacteraceae bacterium]|nr:molybdenum ABC transporter ATP-binding protein [Paracoccaceae bacterium]
MTVLSLKISSQHDGFSLEIDRTIPISGVTALFGPSGAGKSTLLRIIAGFERGTGCVAYGDEVWEDGRHFVPPHRRGVATVFQTPTLFPHLDVQGNLAYAARRAGQSGTVAAMLERFDLTGLGARNPLTLSGGEAQRVALARALLTRPRLILMDEPLAALDHARRAEIFPFIERLRDEAQVPILYVTHSPAEVARLAGRMLTLRAGRVTGLGPTAELLAVADVSTEESGEPGSLVTARVVGQTGDGLTELAFSGGAILTPETIGAPGSTVRLFIRARDVMIARDRPEGLSALNILPATVYTVANAGPASADVLLRCGEARLRARLTRRSVAALGLEEGTGCHAIVKSVALARE